MREGSKPADAAAVEREVAALADPERAAWTARSLGIEAGGYGEGEVLLGIPVPAQRRGAPDRDRRIAVVATLALIHRGGSARRSRSPAA